MLRCLQKQLASCTRSSNITTQTCSSPKLSSISGSNRMSKSKAIIMSEHQYQSELVPSSLMRARNRYVAMNMTITSTSESNSTTTTGGRKSKKNVNHNHKKIHQQQTQNEQIVVERSNFYSFLQSFGDQSNTKRFKVHKPNCTCPKIKTLLTTIASSKEDSHSSTTISSIQRGFIVVPDMSKITSVFAYNPNDDDVTDNDDDDDKTRLHNTTSICLNETKLLQRIMMIHNNDNDTTKSNNGNATSSSSTVSLFPPSIKIRCANCLLDIEPNGFSCILSNSKTNVQTIIQYANYHKSKKNVLHADHAHYLCTIPIQLLSELSLCEYRMKMAKKKKNDDEMKKIKFWYQNLAESFMNCLIQEGIPSTDDIGTTDTRNITNDNVQVVDVEIGYHLSAILRLLSCKNKIDDRFMMTTLHLQKNKWEVNIPGGKRYLGESSWQCAIREMEEESSLVIDDKWLIYEDCEENNSHDTCSISNNCKSETFRYNRYFFLEAPADLIMDSVIGDAFWKQSKIY